MMELRINRGLLADTLEFLVEEVVGKLSIDTTSEIQAISLNPTEKWEPVLFLSWMLKKPEERFVLSASPAEFPYYQDSLTTSGHFTRDFMEQIN